MEITPEFFKSQLLVNALENEFHDLDFRDREEKREVIITSFSLFLDENLSQEDWQFIALALLKIIWSEEDDSING